MSHSHYADISARIRGLVLNVPVPFTGDDYAIDVAGLQANVERWIDAGIQTLLLTYGTSEYFAMSEEEIATVTRTVAEVNRGRALVIASTGRWWLNKAIDFARTCESWGVDALMCTPMDSIGWNTLANIEELVDFYREVQHRTQIALVYHSWYDGPSTIDAAERVCSLEHVVGLKQEFDRYPLLLEMGQRLGDKTTLINGAGGVQAYFGHQFGFQASLTGIGQWAPRLELRGVDAMMSGRLDEAKRHVDLILPLRRLAARIGNHQAIKHAMDVAGYAGGRCRPPSKNLRDDQRAALTECIERDGLLRIDASLATSR